MQNSGCESKCLSINSSRSFSTLDSYLSNLQQNDFNTVSREDAQRNKNPKSEYRNPKQTQRQINLKSGKSKTTNPKEACLEFYIFWSFEIVSTFGFRASNFCTRRLWDTCSCYVLIPRQLAAGSSILVLHFSSARLFVALQAGGGNLPQSARRDRQRRDMNPQRRQCIFDRAGDGRRRDHGAAFADALGAEQCQR